MGKKASRRVDDDEEEEAEEEKKNIRGSDIFIFPDMRFNQPSHMT